MPLSDFAYSEDVGTISRVTFGILSPQRIKEKSVCEIYKHITSHKNLEGTVSDPRLGPIESGKVCPSCFGTYKTCPGHFGHLNLAKPVIQIHFYTTIIKLLGCFCNRCSSILLNKHDPYVRKEIKSKKTKGRFVYVLANIEKNCPNCGAVQPKYTKDKEGVARIIATYQNKIGGQGELSQHLNPEIIHHMFKNISDEDVELVGLNPKLSRPEWMIWTIMPIPPPAMRPSVKMDSGKESDDDLTHKINDIIKFNNQLRIKLEEQTKQAYIDDWWQLVQYHVATYVDNEISNVPKATHTRGSGRPLKTIRQRVKAKEGRVRGNLMGKRVDGSARSVITADPNLSLDQLGVPVKIATNLTYPEIVTSYNISQLTQLVRNGPDVYPGAKSYKKADDGDKINLKFNKKRHEIVLAVGDIVYRHLMDNDWVLFNRQPSLHKMSMMAHRIKVLEGDTFRLNVNVTSPYNADFDGDEMNMHVAQTMESVCELKYLVSVPTQIVSPQSSSPVMGLVQDGLLGTYLFTKTKSLNIQQMMKLIGNMGSYGGNLPSPSPVSGQSWTPQQLLSYLMPEITCYRKHESDGVSEPLSIRGGQMKSGILDKTTLGAKNGSLFHITWNDHGPIQTRDFFDNISSVANTWLLMEGFSVGLSDCVTTDGVLKMVKDLIHGCKKDAAKSIESVRLGASDKNADFQTIKKNFPSKIMTLLGEYKGQIEKLTYKNLEAKNAINTMVTAGSKGNKTNIVQIISMLGQQDIEGTWIGEQMYRRTLPHYHKDDLSPEAHGFVSNSFMSGLDPAEYWFHAQAGRVGVISKAIKTAETGYIQRKLVKAMEDLRVCYDGTVRNANNIIVQTVYGNDGFDANYHETQKLDFLNYSMSKLRHHYQHDSKDTLEKIITYESYKQFIETINYASALDDEFKKIIEYYDYIKTHVFPSSIPEKIKCPINFQRIIQNVSAKFNLHEKSIADINPVYIVEQVKQLRKKMVIDPSEDINYVSTIILHTLLSTNLSSKNLIYNHKFDKVSFDYLIKTIFIMFMRNLVNPGENVGVIAAQSIGEPATQMTLDTFHFTGIGSKANVSRGVPRLRELLSLTRNPRTPSLMVLLQDATYPSVLETEFVVLKDITKIKVENIDGKTPHKTIIIEYNKEKLTPIHINLIEHNLSQLLRTYRIDETFSKINTFRSTIDIKSDDVPEDQDEELYIEGIVNSISSIEIKGVNWEKAEKLLAKMEYTILSDLLVKTEIYYDQDDHNTCVREDQEFIDTYYSMLPDDVNDEKNATAQWLLRLEFNREQMMNKHITMIEIEHKIENFLVNYDDRHINHNVIVNDDNSNKMICRIKIGNETIPTDQDPVQFLRTFEKNLLSMEIQGINGISKGHIRTVKKDIMMSDGTIISPFDKKYKEMSKEYNHMSYVVDTNGSNLIDVLNLQGVDKYNTICNDAWEVYSIYGIEAARSCLIHEIIDVLEYNGTDISHRHVELLVDVMTNQGTLVSVDRHGVNKTDSGPLHRASFEETTTQIVNASIFNEVDQMTGVSGNIMFGQFIQTGTNSFKIGLDVDKLLSQVHPVQEVDRKHRIEPKQIITKLISQIDKTDQCQVEDFDFTFKINMKL
jgi:DNA-directed RNA polymerase beta' subunit